MATSKMSAPTDMMCDKPADKSVKFRYDQLGSELLGGMNRQRREGRFFDITIVAGNKTIMAHKIILASFSRYFEALLNPNMKEGHQDEICLPALHGETTLELIDFAYTGEITLTLDNIETLIETANFLAVEPVIKACSDFMQTNITAENCIGICNCAELYSLKDLKSFAFEYALKHFADVVKSDELANLPIDDFKALIGSEDIMILKDDVLQVPEKQEHIILKSVLSYVEANDLAQSPDFLDILKLVRLPHLSKSKISSLESHQLVKNNKEVLTLVTRAKKTKPASVLDYSSEVWMRPRSIGEIYDKYTCIFYLYNMHFIFNSLRLT